MSHNDFLEGKSRIWRYLTSPRESIQPITVEILLSYRLISERNADGNKNQRKTMATWLLYTYKNTQCVNISMLLLARTVHNPSYSSYIASYLQEARVYICTIVWLTIVPQTCHSGYLNRKWHWEELALCEAHHHVRSRLTALYTRH